MLKLQLKQGLYNIYFYDMQVASASFSTVIDELQRFGVSLSEASYAMEILLQNWDHNTVEFGPALKVTRSYKHGQGDIFS